MEQIALMENERRLNARDREAERSGYEQRIGELSNHIKSMEDTQEDVNKELIQSKTDFRKTERHWMAEKEFLMRKVQFLQTYGSVVPPSIGKDQLLYFSCLFTFKLQMSAVCF